MLVASKVTIARGYRHQLEICPYALVWSLSAALTVSGTQAPLVLRLATRFPRTPVLRQLRGGMGDAAMVWVQRSVSTLPRSAPVELWREPASAWLDVVAALLAASLAFARPLTRPAVLLDVSWRRSRPPPLGP